MALRMLSVAIILLATFSVSDFARIKLNKSSKLRKAVGAQSPEDGTTRAANGAEADSAGARITASGSPGSLVQGEVSQGLAFSQPGRSSPGRSSPGRSSPGRSSPGFMTGLVRKQVSNEPPSNFSKTLDYVQRANAAHSRFVLMAACDSSSFTCQEVIQFASFVCDATRESDWESVQITMPWANIAVLFAKRRNSSGCISDPANAASIVDSFENRRAEMERPYQLGGIYEEGLDLLQRAFIDNEHLKPAKGIAQPPMQLQTGCRAETEFTNLLRDMRALQLVKHLGRGHPHLWKPEFLMWLKDIRADGLQFSGPQLVTLAFAIPKNVKIPEAHTTHAISVLLQYLEQYVTGITCEEVNQILGRMGWSGDRYFFAGLSALKSNILDGQNKVAILAHPEMEQMLEISEMDMVLRDVGVGLPPANNAIFGVVKGNPVILVVEESSSMDAKFTLGNDTFTCKKFVHIQMEIVLRGLPAGTYFNVIRYSSSAVKVFRDPVLVSKTNIDAVMKAVIWLGGYTPAQDPAEWLRGIKIFSLEFKHHFDRGTNINSMEALRLAYSTAGSPAQQARARLRPRVQHTPPDYEALDQVVAKNFPQIYFLISGQPDAQANPQGTLGTYEGADQILNQIDQLDKGRKIPVNSIAFVRPADVDAKQFVKRLALKTGGFFRVIEQARYDIQGTQLSEGATLPNRKRKADEVPSFSL